MGRTVGLRFGLCGCEMNTPLRRRKATIRLPGYDYSQDGLYFVTSCLQDMRCLFGHVQNGEMNLGDAGLIAEDQWDWLLQRYPYVKSHAFIVMPNHIHAVLEINRGLIEMKNAENEALRGSGSDPRSRNLEQADAELEEYFKFQHLPPPTLESQLRDQPIKIKPLDQLLGAYKTTTSKMIHAIGIVDFKWQRSYYDHIIRAEDAYDGIVAYIKCNPAQWNEDKYHKY